jgi:hypothetical protein
VTARLACLQKVHFLHDEPGRNCNVGETREVAASSQPMSVGTYAGQDSYPCVMAPTVQQGSKDDVGMKERCPYDEPDASVGPARCRRADPLQ